MSHSGLSCRKAAVKPIDHRLEAVLRYAVAIGAVLVLLLPAARGVHAAIGWLPLWLLAMPLTAWWALRRCRLPVAVQAERPVVTRVRPPTATQARRRARQTRRDVLPRAA